MARAQSHYNAEDNKRRILRAGSLGGTRRSIRVCRGYENDEPAKLENEYAEHSYLQDDENDRPGACPALAEGPGRRVGCNCAVLITSKLGSLLVRHPDAKMADALL